MSRGRPIVTINKENAAFFLNYFNKLFTFQKEPELFFQQSNSVDIARESFKKINTFADNILNIAQFDQKLENEYHRSFAHWLDIYITEQGFQRCLNAFNQALHRTRRKKKVHIYIPEKTNFVLIKLAGDWGLSKQDALIKIIESWGKEH